MAEERPRLNALEERHLLALSGKLIVVGLERRLELDGTLEKVMPGLHIPLVAKLADVLRASHGGIQGVGQYSK